MMNVLITGANGNLGKACALQFASEGYHVIAILSPGKTLSYDVDGKVSQYQADLKDEKNVESVIDQIIKDHQQIDAALLLVGGFAMGSIKDSDGEAIRKMLSINFDTAYLTSRVIFNHMMVKENGRIIFIGSKPALEPDTGKSTLGYALSKSLIFKLAEILNADGASNNVISVVIVPGVIDTPQNRKGMPNTDFSAWVRPEEIAKTISFACSADAKALREPIFKVYGKT